MFSLEALFFSRLEGFFIGLGFCFNHSTCLLDPFVSLNSARIVFNGFIDIVLCSLVKVRQLSVGKDSKSVEFLFAVRTYTLDGLEVVCIFLRSLTNHVEIKGFLTLFNAIHGFLLLRFCLDFIRLNGHVPQEVDTGLSKLDTCLIGSAFVSWHLAVIELEVQNNFSILTYCKNASSFHAECRFKHLETTVIVFIVEVNHVNLNVTHVGDRNDLHTGIHRTGLKRSKRCENERVILRTCS